MRAALYATAALAAGAYAQIELGKCDVTQSELPEPCQLAVSSKFGQSSEQLARATVGGLWFGYRLAVDAFATSTDGTIVVVTKDSDVDNVFALPTVQAQGTVGDTVPEKGRLLLKQSQLPSCDAPIPSVTQKFPETACALKSSNPAPMGCGIIVKSVLKEPLSSQELAASLVGTAQFGFGKGASALQTDTDGQVVLVFEEQPPELVMTAFTASPHISIETKALPVGANKVLSGPKTCRDLVESKSESTSAAKVSTSPSNEEVAEAGQASADQSSSAQRAAEASATRSSSAQRAAISAVWMFGALAFAQ